jgi:hypothetical protein
MSKKSKNRPKGPQQSAQNRAQNASRSAAERAYTDRLRFRGLRWGMRIASEVQPPEGSPEGTAPRLHQEPMSAETLDQFAAFVHDFEIKRRIDAARSPNDPLPTPTDDEVKAAKSREVEAGEYNKALNQVRERARSMVEAGCVVFTPEQWAWLSQFERDAISEARMAQRLGEQAMAAKIAGNDIMAAALMKAAAAGDPDRMREAGTLQMELEAHAFADQLMAQTG